MKFFESVTIILPLPSNRLSPNCPSASFRGRMAKAAVAKKYRRLAKEGTTNAGIDTGPWDYAEISPCFFHKTNRRRDDVNSLAMLKPAYDGIVDAGLLKDDDSEHLRTTGADFRTDKEFPRVEITITRKERPLQKRF